MSTLTGKPRLWFLHFLFLFYYVILLLSTNTLFRISNLKICFTILNYFPNLCSTLIKFHQLLQRLLLHNIPFPLIFQSSVQNFLLYTSLHLLDVLFLYLLPYLQHSLLFPFSRQQTRGLLPHFYFILAFLFFYYCIAYCVFETF